MDVLDKLLFNLKTISGIPQGKKICTSKEFIIIDDGSIAQGFWRWKNAECRDKAVLFICREIRTIIAFSQLVMESRWFAPGQETSPQRPQKAEDLKKIYTSLHNVRQGVANICYTYKDDADVTGHFAPIDKEILACNRLISEFLTTVGVNFNDIPS